MPIEHTAVVTSLFDDGSGLVELDDGLQVIVPGALPGDKITFTIVHKSPHQPLAWGRLLRTIHIGPNHAKPACKIAAPVCGRCGGCALMHMRHGLQAEFKRNLVLSALQKAGIQYISKVKFNSAPNPLHYRNRTDYVVVKTPRGKVVLGSYEPRTHRVVGMPACVILRSPLNAVARFLSEKLGELNAPVYPQKSGVRYVSLLANGDGEVIVDLVCGSDPTAWILGLISKIKSFRAISGLTYSINDSANNAIRISPSTLVYGKDRLPEQIGDVSCFFSPSGFSQLNFETATKMYLTGKTWTGKVRTVWDLYCGSGAFGRTIAPQKALFGAEISPKSIEFARDAAHHDPWQSHYEVLNLGETWPSWPKPDIILVNPPRKGLDALLLQRFVRPPQVPLLYMSCNPQSFAQNCVSLSDQYIITQIEAFDMMPQTKHVEILAYLMPKNIG